MTASLRVAIAPPPANRNVVGIAAVVVLHAILAYAIANGLGHKVVDALRKPLDVALIEEVKLPAPPPPKPTPQPKAVTPPPPAYVPPAEVTVEAPPPVITATAVAPPEPPAPVVSAPEQVNIAVACPNHMEVRRHVPYPARALNLGLSGEVLVEFVVGGGGEIKNVSIVQSTNAVFNRTAIEAVGRFKCTGQGREARVRVPFAFRLES
jgi:protein TonB